MSDCKHGIEESWCSLCRGEVEVQYESTGVDCCAPRCKRSAAKKLGALPLCDQHLLSVEKRIVRVYKSQNYQMPSAKDKMYPGWVYFVQIGDAIKVGYSKEPERRIASLATYSIGTDVRLLALERGDRAKENRIHRMFSESRIVEAGKSRELFEPSEELWEYIRSGRQCSSFHKNGLDPCRLRALPGSLTCRTHSKKGDLGEDSEEAYSLYAKYEIPHEIVA